MTCDRTRRTIRVLAVGTSTLLLLGCSNEAGKSTEATPSLFAAQGVITSALPPQAARIATQEEGEAWRAAMSGSGAPGVAIVDGDENTFRVVRLDSLAETCASVPASLDVIGPSSIRVNYEKASTSDEGCILLGEIVTDELPLPSMSGEDPLQFSIAGSDIRPGDLVSHAHTT